MISHFHPPFEDLLGFLQNEYDNNSSYNTLNTHRSALTLLFSLSDDQNCLVKRFLKGVFKTKPTFPKYTYTWDPAIVLSYLEKQATRSLSLADLTLKLSALLALASAQRVQSLTKISIGDIKIHQGEKIEIFISEILKTSAPNRKQPIISFPFFIEKPELCVASTLLYYIEVTTPVRSVRNQQLLLTFKKPVHPATSQTVSRWIKTVLKRSGIDTTVFKSHSTRHATTSAAARAGLSIDVIREAAGWTEKSQIFNKFYNKPITTGVSFTKTILNLKD